MTIGIIGLGLIGGSMAIDLKRRGFADETIGFEADPVNAAAAEKIGIIDRLVSYEECISRSDIIILAVPAGTAVKLLPDVLDRIACPEAGPVGESGSCGRQKTVIDVCSTKTALAECAGAHPARRQYVSTHPMAGTEYSGPWAAMSGLFDGHACIICDSASSSPEVVALVEELYSVLNMRVLKMDSAGHDMHAAYVSHISHITSFALALTVLDKEKDEKHIFDLASGGFSSTVRLAKSSPDMWTPILLQNRDNILEAVDTYMEKMSLFRDAIAGGDAEAVAGLMSDANRIRRIIR